MPLKFPSNKWHKALLISALSVLIIGVFYGNVILKLNQVNFRILGDGGKNYYNIAYHIKHDKTYTAFDGMNYPYGENLAYVDMHPLLATTLKFTSENVVDISDYTIGILNSLMLFSLWISILFLFFIFRHYGFSDLISLLAAFGIGFLYSGSLLWTIGHFALSYSCFFPIAWYLLIKYKCSDKKLKYAILMLLNTLIWFYTHNYLGMILLSFNFFALSFWYIGKVIPFRKANLFHAFLQIVIPIITVYCIIKFSDTHPGRIEMPYLTAYSASMNTVFLPNHSPLMGFYEYFFDFDFRNTESWWVTGNYVGLATSLVLIVTILYSLFQYAIKRKFKINELIGSKANAWLLLTSIVLLLFSMSIPFKYGLEFLLPTPIRQFIGLGRFAWVFYFIAIFISLLIIKNKLSGRLQKVVSILFCALLIFEASGTHLHIRKKISQQESLFSPQKIEELQNTYLQHINTEDFQAIIPLPFYHGYLSLHNFRDSDTVKAFSMSVSYAIGLPMTSAILSRPSTAESHDIIQLLAPPFYSKPIKDKFPNQKPFLIIGDKQGYSEEENQLLKKATLLFENADFEFYSLPFDSIFEYKASDYLEDFFTNRAQLFEDSVSGLLKSEDLRIVYESFDEEQSKQIYLGSGALQRKKDEFNVVYLGKPGELEFGVDYELSFWYYNYLYDQTLMQFGLR